MFQTGTLQIGGTSSNFGRRKRNNDIYPNDELASGFAKQNTVNLR